MVLVYADNRRKKSPWRAGLKWEIVKVVLGGTNQSLHGTYFKSNGYLTFITSTW